MTDDVPAADPHSHTHRVVLRLADRATILLAVTVGLTTCCIRQSSRRRVPPHAGIAGRGVERDGRSTPRAEKRRAVEAIERAIARDPNNAAAYADLGRARAACGDFARAADAFRCALKCDPENAEHALALADILTCQAATALNREQLLRAALRNYRHAGRLDPGQFDAAMGLAMCYRQLGELDPAIGALHDAEGIDPDAAVVHVELASIYRAWGEYDRALARCRLALKVDPDNVAAHNAAGEINLLLSRHPTLKRPLARQRAIAHFSKSLQDDPDQPRIRAMLSTIGPPTPPLAGISEAEDDGSE